MDNIKPSNCPACGDGWLDDASSQRYGLAGDELVRRQRESAPKVEADNRAS